MRLEADHDPSVAFELCVTSKTSLERPVPGPVPFVIEPDRGGADKPSAADYAAMQRYPVPHRISA